MSKIQIEDKQNRAALAEGRTYGIGYAYLKPLGKNKFETVQPISPCKDYLNDVVYVENVGGEITACGLRYAKKDIFDGKNTYLGMKFLDRNRATTKGATFDKDKEVLNTNYKNIEKLINWVEDQLKISKTEITPGNDEMYLIKGPFYWSTSTYLISLYGLILRMGLNYDGVVDPRDFLNDYPPKDNDYYTWNMVRIKLLAIIGGSKVEQVFDKKTGSTIHSAGIASFNGFKL